VEKKRTIRGGGRDYPNRLTILLRSATQEDAGQEILEAAIVLPILFLLFLAIFWFGRAFNISSTLDRAAREAVKAASQPLCATCGNTFPPPSQVVGHVTSVLNANNLYIQRVQPYSPSFACTPATPPSCTTSQNIQICTGVPVTCGNAACQSPTPAPCGTNPTLGVRVTFAYQTPSPLTIANLPPITIHASAQSESEN
jgi:Flp pilus assembly protein TadG